MKEYFPINRRGILSTLCTGTLTLLAPVVACAKPRRWVGFHNRGVKPMVIAPCEDLMNDASGTGRYIAALERVATAAARIYNEGSTLYCGPPEGKFVRHNSVDASLEFEASICDLRDGYHLQMRL